jgi:hypothetical protein
MRRVAKARAAAAPRKASALAASGRFLVVSLLAVVAASVIALGETESGTPNSADRTTAGHRTLAASLRP